MFKMKLMALMMVVIFSGCVSVTRQSPLLSEKMKSIKTIAILPVDVKVYKISAGGVQEEMDEWSVQATKFITDSLTKHVGSRSDIKIKFIDKDFLKNQPRETWKNNQALYEAIAQSALQHAYPGMETFQSKVTNFDYTLGTDLEQLAKVCDADAVLFISGFDTEVTAGRVATELWTQLLGAVAGVSIVYSHPTFLNIGVVDGKSGDVLWFKVNNPASEYSFKKKEHVDNLIELKTLNLLKSST